MNTPDLLDRPATLDTLHAALDDGLAWPPEYRSGLSSHLPMALHALWSLGAPPERLHAFAARYAERFGAARAPRGGRVLADWRDARGRIEAWADLRETFAAQIRHDGTDATLRRVLPDLWPGAAGAAFHGLIRTGHAVQAGHAGELVAALAYWAARWQVVAAGVPGEPLAFGDWAARLETAALRARWPGALISSRIEVAAASDDHAQLAERVAVDDLHPLSNLAADLYARSGNFTVLHVVTATRAARVLLPWVEDAAAVRAGLVRAVTAAVLASHLQWKEAPPPARSWAEVRADAIASDDDHVVKIVHALWEERGVYGDGARLAAAARAEG
ncbi:MAG: DUF4243 domain-containing protein [Rubrivivax sp.]|nr:DUF4243 domain-containing protein [Rubrivivax sp.]